MTTFFIFCSAGPVWSLTQCVSIYFLTLESCLVIGVKENVIVSVTLRKLLRKSSLGQEWETSRYLRVLRPIFLLSGKVLPDKCQITWQVSDWPNLKCEMTFVRCVGTHPNSRSMGLTLQGTWRRVRCGQMELLMCQLSKQIIFEKGNYDLVTRPCKVCLSRSLGFCIADGD